MISSLVITQARVRCCDSIKVEGSSRWLKYPVETQLVGSPVLTRFLLETTPLLMFALPHDQGQTVTFRHRVTNIGAGNMERRLNAYAEWNGGVKAGDGVRRNCDVAGGLNAGQTDNGCTNDYTIPGGASPGSLYCQRLVVSPHSIRAPLRVHECA